MNRRPKDYRWLCDPRRATNTLVTDRERNDRAWLALRGRLQVAYGRETDGVDKLAARFGIPLIY